MRQLLAALFFSSIFLIACGDDDGTECSPGFEGCVCAPGNQCLAGLSCFSNTCVNVVPERDGGVGGDDGGRGDAGRSADGSVIRRDGGGDGGMSMGDADIEIGPNPDAFFAEDPPPEECREDGTRGTPSEVPGGTPECPDDKNREGCRCDTVGESAPCWPGLRVNRNRGICHDGRTTCEQFGEFGGRWSACEGYVLPTEGVELGPAACGCFSRGRWELQNLSPCFFTSGGTVTAVSTEIRPGETQAACPMLMSTPVVPGALPWSENTVTVDCEGRFELCYTLRAGDFDTPLDADCTVMTICSEDWYSERDVAQAFPVLGSWIGDDPACARQFRDSGGYGEMSVQGLSVECEEIGDGGESYVFNRVRYCPLSCFSDPPPSPVPAECEGCGMGGGGSF